MRFLLLSCVVLFAFAGCTEIHVRKIRATDGESQVRGIRYALPKAFLSFTPKDDGTMAVDDVYLPDSDNMYAIDASSILANHTLTVKLDKGLLTKIEYKPDSSAIAQQVVSSSAEVAKSRLDTLAKEKAAETDKINAARKALDDAELAVKLAQAKVERTDKARKEPSLDAQRKAAAEAAFASAEADLQDAAIKRDAAKAALDKLQAQALKLGAGPGTADPREPSLFLLFEDADTVQLRRVPLKDIDPKR